MLAACSGDTKARTQLVVAVDSNLGVPDELDEIRVEARNLSADAAPGEAAEGMLGDGGLSLPVTVTLEPAGNSLGPIEVIASGFLDGVLVVSQTRELSFARDKSVVLKMTLTRACIAEASTCDDDETCVEGECTARVIDVGDLPGYSGPDDLGSFDAGSAGSDAGGDGDGSVASDGGNGDGSVASDGGDGDGDGDSGADAGDCEPATEVCNQLDDDCDREVDEDFDFGSLAHCGSCHNACPSEPTFAASACSQGQCVIVCAPGTQNCDGMLDNGCETVLNTATDCGDCDADCDGSTPICAADESGATCTDSCNSVGTTQCDNACVDTQTDIFHCSDCDMPCDGAPNASPKCEAGVCGIDCLGDFDDCDDDESNGCEVDTLSDPDHCGGCGAQHVCPARGNAQRTCIDGACGFVCNAGRGDCDDVATNGCETATTNNAGHCGACGNACSSCCAGTRCGTLGLLGACL